jgi:hypothetical protein
VEVATGTEARAAAVASLAEVVVSAARPQGHPAGTAEVVERARVVVAMAVAASVEYMEGEAMAVVVGREAASQAVEVALAGPMALVMVAASAEGILVGTEAREVEVAMAMAATPEAVATVRAALAVAVMVAVERMAVVEGTAAGYWARPAGMTEAGMEMRRVAATSAVASLAGAAVPAVSMVVAMSGVAGMQVVEQVEGGLVVESKGRAVAEVGGGGQGGLEVATAMVAAVAVMAVVAAEVGGSEVVVRSVAAQSAAAMAIPTKST